MFSLDSFPPTAISVPMVACLGTMRGERLVGSWNRSGTSWKRFASSTRSLHSMLCLTSWFWSTRVIRNLVSRRGSLTADKRFGRWSFLTSGLDWTQRISESNTTSSLGTFNFSESRRDWRCWNGCFKNSSFWQTS